MPVDRSPPFLPAGDLCDRSVRDIAALLRTRVFHAMRTFLERYEFLIAPVNQVPPFPVDQPYVTAINGVPMGSYIEWMRSCTRISITSHPAASVPCGFTNGGLPVGVQVVGRYRNEFGVLQMAHAIEGANPNAGRRPGAAGGQA